MNKHWKFRYNIAFLWPVRVMVGTKNGTTYRTSYYTTLERALAGYRLEVTTGNADELPIRPKIWMGHKELIRRLKEVCTVYSW